MANHSVLWRTYGDCDNYGKLTGHKGAVLDLQWSRDSSVVFSASADMTLASWDLETGLRIRRHIGHEEVINCLDVSRRGEEILVSGSDDGHIGVRMLSLDWLIVDMGSAKERGGQLSRFQLSSDCYCDV
jgi:WD40 repeat protein